jgi:hypothetical protein
MIRFLLALLALIPTPALAWWEFGHYTVADIAFAEVKPATRARITALLRHQRALDTPECPVRSIAQAAYWPDCIKQYRERFSYQNSWHYQNVDVCKPFDLKAACRDGNCVSAQITRNAKLLGDRKLPPRERLMALAYLTHFVGDLHMPLHAGDRGDRGGNDLKASYGLYAPDRLNIHAVWDGYLAERAITTPPTGALGLLLMRQPELADGRVEDWSRESWDASRDLVYAGAGGGNPCAPKPERVAMDNAMIERFIPAVRAQILKGGMRLTRLLDEALG